MKNVQGYSKKKFDAFDLQKKKKVIIDLIQAVEANWSTKETRLELLTVLHDCITWTGDNELILRSEKLLETCELDEFLKIMVPWEQKNYRELRDKDFIILSRDGRQGPSSKLELTVILLNLRSAFNVGNIIRTAECLGVEKMIFCGYTPTPDNVKVMDTSMGTYEFLNWEKRGNASEVIRDYRTGNYHIYGLETTSNAINIYGSDITSPAVLILGNEAHGISRNVLELCDGIIQIPTGGWKNSLNVGVSFAVAGYEILRKWKYTDQVTSHP